MTRALDEVIEVVAQGPVGGWWLERQWTPQGRAQLGQRAVQLVAETRAGRGGQLALRPQDEGDAEHALHHAVVQLPREGEPLGQAAGTLVLAGHHPGARGESGRLAQRPQRVAL